MKIKINKITVFSSMVGLLYFFCHSFIFSQDIEPSPLKLNFKFGDTVYTNQPFSQDLFKQSKFRISTQWAGQLQIEKALLITQYS